jgi:methionyl aminopeptidase
MSIDSDDDLQALRRVGQLIGQALAAMERAAAPGMTTADLDDVGAKVLKAGGARSAPQLVYGFPGFNLLSVNDEIVHGIPGRRRLEPGDVLKLDVTAELDGYIADAARTVVLAPGTPVAERLRDSARHAFDRAAGVARAGELVSTIGRHVEESVKADGFNVVRALSGHGVGRTIHEAPSVPNYFDRRQRDVLTEGLVLTIEPIISERPCRAVDSRDGWTIRTSDGSLAAHYEETIVITSGAPIVLTALPRPRTEPRLTA